MNKYRFICFLLLFIHSFTIAADQEVLSDIEKNSKLLNDIKIRESELTIILIDGTEIYATQVLSLNQENVIVNKMRTRWTNFTYSKNWEWEKQAVLAVSIPLAEISSIEEISRTNYFKEILYLGGISLFIYAVLLNV